MVLSSVGHAKLDLDNVQKTMNFVIGQDTKLEGSRWTRIQGPSDVQRRDLHIVSMA